MKYFALLKDSLAETLDRKSLYVVLILAGLIILLLSSIGFRQMDAAETLALIVRDFRDIHSESDPMHPHSTDVTYEARDVAKDGSDYTFTLHAKPASKFHEAVSTWNSKQGGPAKKEGEALDPALVVKFLKHQFRQQMIVRTDIEPVGVAGDAEQFKITLWNPRYVALQGAHQISFLFGAYSARLPFSLAIFLIIVEVLVSEWIVGFFGLLLAIIFTAGFVPGMLQKGTLDLVLAKPVRRPYLLLAKWAGAILYVAIPAIVLIGGAWLVISWRSGFFNYGFLATIGILLLIFAVLYSFSVLAGVLTRSTVATILLTIGVWFAAFLVSVAIHLPQQGMAVPRSLVKTAETVRLVLPRTTELQQVAGYYIVVGNLGPEIKAFRESRGASEDLKKPEWPSLALSSGGFIVVMLGLACWIFSRRDC